MRQQYRKVLLGISPEERAAKSRLVCKNLVATEQFARAQTVMSYLSLPHEVDTADVILCAWQLSKKVAAPKISWQQRHMLPVEINTLDTGFSMNAGGVRNPVKGVPMPIEEIDMVITPGLVFDRTGSRLGKGGSYYDDFFKHKHLKAVKCGLAFEQQLIDDVPVDESDVPVNMLVTEKQVYYFNSEKG